MGRPWEERGRRVRIARREAGMTVAALAVALSRSPDTIYRWEQGRSSPSLDDIVAIGRVTGRRPSFFVDDKREVAA